MSTTTTRWSTWLEHETLLSERSGGAVRLTLNRPDSLNAMNPQLATDLTEAVRAAGDDEGIRAVLVRGAGRGFSSGGDLTAQSDLSVPEVMRRYYNPLILAIRELPKPVVAAVHGAGVGVGCSVALACDLVVMSRSAYFLLAFTKVGLVPDGGASLLAARRAGGGRATRMALLAEKVPAEQALAWGLADEVLDDEALDAGAEALAQRLATGPSVAYGATKQLLHRATYHGLPEELDREADLQGEMCATADFAEAVAAFREKRPAVFEGR